MAHASKAALAELSELCEEVLDTDASQTVLIRQIRLESESDDFTETDCQDYIEYLREVAFKNMNRR